MVRPLSMDPNRSHLQSHSLPAHVRIQTIRQTTEHTNLQRVVGVGQGDSIAYIDKNLPCRSTLANKET